MIEKLVGKHLEVAIEATEKIKAGIARVALQAMDSVDSKWANKINTEEDES